MMVPDLWLVDDHGGGIVSQEPHLGRSLADGTEGWLSIKGNQAGRWCCRWLGLFRDVSFISYLWSGVSLHAIKYLK